MKDIRSIISVSLMKRNIAATGKFWRESETLRRSFDHIGVAPPVEFPTLGSHPLSGK